MVKLGIDILKSGGGVDLTGQRLGLLSNHASLDSGLHFTRDVVHELYGSDLTALFSPQHGFFGVEQDNMKESPHTTDDRLGIPIYSLYSETREPTDEMFDGIDALIVDLFDVGTRVYTFIYTMALCMKRAAATGKRVIVLDRPNPISAAVEGNIVSDKFTSFVGMYPIVMRHGLTIGELATLFNSEFSIGCDLTVIKMEGYDKGSYYDDTQLTFPFPSPNMPTLDTAIVYPGQVIFEGTNISEGRGTARPFELFGAPFIVPDELIRALYRHELTGVRFMETRFKPTFNKYAGEVCRGLCLHVTDRASYRPYITSLTILSELVRLYPNEVKFLPTPYEYEHEKLPFDIITGDDYIRESISLENGMDRIKRRFKDDEESFKKMAEGCRLY